MLPRLRCERLVIPDKSFTLLMMLNPKLPLSTGIISPSVFVLKDFRRNLFSKEEPIEKLLLLAKPA